MEGKLPIAYVVGQVRSITGAAIRLNKLVGDSTTVSEDAGCRVLVGGYSVGRTFDFIADLRRYPGYSYSAYLARSQPDFKLKLW